MAFPRATNSDWGSIALSLCFLVPLTWRAHAIYILPKRSTPGSQRSVQILFAAAICIIHLTSTGGLWNYAQFYNDSAALDACLSAVIVSGILAVLILEHSRGVESHLIPAYLAVALARDVYEMWNEECRASSGCRAVKLRLCLEALWFVSCNRPRGWKEYLKSHVSTSEDAAGTFSLLFFSWMTPMLREGYVSALSTASLPEIYHMLLSRALRTRVIESWTSRSESTHLQPYIMLIFTS
ncbi:hypothetical protein ASPBRDRAFT_589576 [Aspergillus brasiliensis CBS 101740]|uniref:Uncharacterized protein n=1 Tax=Aspergillus brasiliensis (strain CBS 101740 / IMI 381727 / IBT 21946) TaxID=767769 RepID=A0A1L9UKJ5_ASPBC|nr:hypothetical protein ASPBRDRAFT_589576 [Aspergillus brasiliensis CBS 101740]